MKIQNSTLAALVLGASVFAAAMPGTVLAKNGSDDSKPRQEDRQQDRQEDRAGSGSGSGKSVKKDARGMKAGEFRLRGKAGDSPAIEASADYREKIRKGSVVERRFTAEVEGAQPGDTFAVSINGRSFGTITANSLGVAKLELRPRADSPGDTQIPSDFPVLKAGDVVQIGTFAVTLRRK